MADLGAVKMNKAGTDCDISPAQITLVRHVGQGCRDAQIAVVASRPESLRRSQDFTDIRKPWCKRILGIAARYSAAHVLLSLPTG